MFGLSSDPFILDERAFWSQPWRIATTVLPHGSPFHLFFNIFWTWTLGVAIEHIFGPRRWALLVIGSAAVSSASEWAVTSSPIGLSGVGYAMFTFLWSMGRRDPRLAVLIDRRTVQVFAAWFFVCIALTVSGAMNVANVAHGVGALVGYLVAAIVAPRKFPRWAAISALAGLAVVAGFAAGPGRERLNPWAVAGTLFDRSQPMLEGERFQEASILLERARTLSPRDERVIAFLTYSLMKLREHDRALQTLDTYIAAAGHGSDLVFVSALAGSADCFEKGWPQAAFDYSQRAERLKPGDARPSAFAARALGAMDEVELAVAEAERSLRLDPSQADLRDLIKALRTDGHAGSDGDGTDPAPVPDPQ
jgi:membrane associated rhomboid family serine protease